MRGKRAKQYRKLMKQFALTFHFREPYQVLIDAQMIQDADKFTMDLLGGLERTLHGKVKPMITQCSIRHLYALNTPDLSTSRKEALISQAKNMERRRCNHHTLDEPLSSLECFKEVIDPKGSLTNKNRYVVASQGDDIRAFCRTVQGVPLVYVKRSVMVMEPMAASSLGVQAGLEKEKMRTGIKSAKKDIQGAKRKREADQDNSGAVEEEVGLKDGEAYATKRRKTRGPKGPNPLSVKKPKTAQTLKMMDEAELELGSSGAMRKQALSSSVDSRGIVDGMQQQGESPEVTSRRKRKRKHKPGGLSEIESPSVVAIE